MDLLAAVNRGAPPIGLGVFLRAGYVDGPWAWCAIVADANYAHDVGAARAAGKQVWLYSMPGAFTPATWRDGLANLLAKCAEVHAEGIIVDPETGWGPGDNESISAFGAALQDAATRTRVGITSYPSWGPIGGLAHAAGDACFGIPQLYGQQGAFTESEIATYWSRWRALFGTRLVVGFALWVPADHAELGTPAVYDAYLSRLPNAGGAIGWTSGPIPVHMMQAITRHYTGAASALTFYGLGSLAWVGRPMGAVVAGIAIAIVIMAILLAREVSRA